MDKVFAKNGTLRMPIKGAGTLAWVKIGFYLRLTEGGYGLDVSREDFDTTKDMPFSFSHYIAPPVDRLKIQAEIADFLKERNDVLEKLAQKEKTNRRKLGF